MSGSVRKSLCVDFLLHEPHPLFFVTDILVQKTFYNERKPPKYQGTKITLLICLNSRSVWKTILSDGVLELVSDERVGLLWLTCRNAKNERKGKEWFHLAHQFLRRNALSLAIFNRFSQYSVLPVVSGRSGHGPGGGTPIWNRRGCSSEILNLTPKGDHLGVAQAFCDP